MLPFTATKYPNPATVDGYIIAVIGYFVAVNGYTNLIYKAVQYPHGVCSLLKIYALMYYEFELFLSFFSYFMSYEAHYCHWK